LQKFYLVFILIATSWLLSCSRRTLVAVEEGNLIYLSGQMEDIPHWGDPEWTFFFIVRHAEKVDQSSNPDLSPRGYARATSLGGVLKKANIDAVFATEKLRSQKTAEAAQKVLGSVPIFTYPPAPQQANDPKAEAQWLENQLLVNKGKRLLVVGHSNTVTRMVNTLRGPGSVLLELPEDDYATIFIVASRGLGQTEYIRKRY
jgi:2,3-bisphosphoglycerate-dependent phosphoglycerate mutase